MKENIENSKELGLLSKKLATIMLDCPVEFDEKDFELNHPNFEKTTEIFKELEFRRIAESFNKLFKESPKPSINEPEKSEGSKQPIAEGKQFDLFAVNTSSNEKQTLSSNNNSNLNSNTVYQSVTTPFARKLLITYLIQQKSVSIYFETTQINSLESEILGIAFSYETGKGYYVFIDTKKNEVSEILQEFKPFFENDAIEKVSHDTKSSIKLLKQYNIELKGKLFDTMLAHYLINPDMRHDLSVLSETYLNHQLQTIETVTGKKGKNQDLTAEVAIVAQANYTIEIADITLRLKAVFEKNLEENTLTKLYNTLEIPLIPVLASMELEGINIDSEFLHSLSKDLTNDIKILENQIYKEAGVEFNLASPKQLGDVLFEQLKLIDKPKKTKTGQYATGEEILSKLATEHKIVQNILDWRGLVKLKNTYVDALPNEINTKTGRIHTTYSQTVAVTGRLSSLNPNLQNIPIRTERGRQVRKAFIPRTNEYLLVSADYSQIELRIIAALSNDESMIESFKRGEDIHAATAAKVYNVPLNEVTRAQRSDAKAVNFGIIYGQGAFTLAQQLNKSRTEAKELIDNYYHSFPTLKNYIANQVNSARENGYVETILGRRRYLNNINSQNAVVRAGDERNAVNAPIQGSAADIIKIAMIKIHELLQNGNYKSKMLLQIHDELVFDMYKSELKTLKPLIKNEMENAFKMAVPLTVEIDEGENWLEAH